MIKNYFRIAIRNLVRYKGYTAINISGLAIGIAACLLIFVVVQYELSYDKFQPNYDRVYRVVSSGKSSSGKVSTNPGIPCPAYDALKADFPQFEKIAALASTSESQITILGTNANSDVTTSKKLIEEGNIGFTQPEYFDIFKMKWFAGSPASLARPGTAVLDQKTAIKYFGDWQQAMNQFIKLDNAVLVQVVGIIEDAKPNSDFPISFFVSYETFKQNPDYFNYSPEWGSISSNHQVYILLPKNVTAQSISAQLPAFIKKHYEQSDRFTRFHTLQPLKEMHFDQTYGTFGDHSTSKNILWTLALIGVLIIVMASINFVNLSTAQAVGRSKEVGIRKVLGSQRGQLIAQVLGETFLIVLIGIILAIGIATLAMPFLSRVASVPATISLFSIGTVLFLVAVLISVTLLSGIYPALIVSGFRPALALKSKITSANVGGISLRRILVVTQFSISQVLIIGTIVAVSQMNYVRNADLGFDKEAVFVVPGYSDSVNLARMQPFKQQLLQNANVLSVAFASDEASSDNNWASNFGFDHKEDEDYAVFHKFGDEDYIKTFGLQLVAGRNYQPSDTSREVVINETLVKKLGLKSPDEAVGKTIRIGHQTWLPVVGVVKDFHMNSLKEELKPLTITSRQRFYYVAAVKVRTANLTQTTAAVQKLWEKTYPEYAFRGHFADETIDLFYRQETQLALLYKIFAGIAIFISCLGLYGLVSFMAAQKTKEVGIRKVLGASVGSIVYMFSREFTILIALAFVISAPIAWYVMKNWLQNFQFQISVGWGVFALAIVSSIIIAWITVGYKAIKAAVANPVKSLRSE
ncbi:MAG: ABC transporter permease [Chitinophagaceae bacterium]|nr:ABC transporter permease [Chitinophagaceae bacterium]